MTVLGLNVSKMETKGKDLLSIEDGMLVKSYMEDAS